MTNPYAWFLSDLESTPKNGLKVFSTFSCGGGSSMGYKLAGCDVIGANDIDPEMAKQYKLNLNPKHYYLCPVKDLLTAKLPDELFDLDILDGSPPCSTFSVSGSREKVWGKEKHFREGQTKQVLSDLFFDYLDLIAHLRPKVAIAENVNGMIIGKAKGYAKLVMRRFREIGYRPQLFLVNAADCGVPQKRERVFFIALRNDIEKPKLVLAPKHPWVSAGEATEDVQGIFDSKLTKQQDKFFDKWRPGESLGDFFERFSLKRRCFNENKIQSNKPSNTLSASVRNFVHWEYRRHLNYMEWVRLGSFPDDYKADNHQIGKYIIGMSVPPKMMETVARAVIEQWLNNLEFR